MINVYYNDYISLDVKTVPSRLKLLEIKKIWEKNPNINLIKNKEISEEDIKIVHSSKYVDDIFNGKIHNGFLNFNQEYARMDLLQCQSMLEASIDAIQNKISCSLSAGFHHAHYETIGAYCTFNGIAYSVVKLKELNMIGKVGIIDLDFHQGDGTKDIIRKLNLNYVANWDSADYSGNNIFKFFLDMEKGLNSMKDCDLIIFVAGMDMYEKDPKGGFMTKDQLKTRDRMVFNWAKKNNIPIVWTLAGGYTEMDEVVSLHNNTMDIAIEILST